MKYGEKFVSVDEREKEFLLFCNRHADDDSCVKCPLNNKANKRLGCAYAWLDLEADEKPMPCPFCGGECRIVKNKNDMFVVGCDYCCYASQDFEREQDAVAAHNRVCKAVEAYNQKGV